MQDKKKYIYYGIIVVCVGVMVWAFMTMNSGSAPESDLAPTNANSGEDVPVSSVGTSTKKQDYLLKEYVAPNVFPENKRYNSKVLESEEIKTMNDYELVSVPEDQFGKDNLFAPFQPAE